MIRKPDRDLQRAFWKADAWHAVCAEPLFRWTSPDSERHGLYKFVAITFWAFLLVSICFALGGIGLAFVLSTVAVIAGAGVLLRRSLMYWSILRYGAWKGMPREMSAILEQPSDMAAAPASFAPMPQGFTPVIGGSDCSNAFGEDKQ